MKRSKPIRRTPVKKKRKGTRRGQATPEEVDGIRQAVYERSSGRCELQLGPDCIPGVLPWDGPTPWSHGHLVHIRGKRMHGTSIENSKWGCHVCHLVRLHLEGGNGKICPPKAQPEIEFKRG